jgi:hypothetical protein
MTEETAVSIDGDEHPERCMRHFCTADRRIRGAHRGAPVIVSEVPIRVQVSMYAEATHPERPMAEVIGVPRLIPMTMARGLAVALTDASEIGQPEPKQEGAAA